MLVGSYASSFYGEPRSTHDIDVLVDLPPSKIDSLLAAVPDDRYYLSGVALREGRMANLIDTVTGDKIDLFLAAGDEPAVATLTRRQQANLHGVTVFVASAEDTIIAKLKWSQQVGGSERQIRDIRGILINQMPKIDLAALRRRVAAEKLCSTWEEEIEPWLENKK